MAAAAIGLTLRIDPMVVLRADADDTLLYAALALAAARLRGPSGPQPDLDDLTP